MNEKANQSFRLSFKFTVALTLIFGAALLAAPPGHTGQKNKPHDMPGMDMHDEDMSGMGQAWQLWRPYVHDPLRPKQPGDKEKVITVVATAKAAIERYKDYRKALDDGYVIANPKLKQPQYHFMNQANTRKLISTSTEQANSIALSPNSDAGIQAGGRDVHSEPDATEDELNERIR